MFRIFKVLGIAIAIVVAVLLFIPAALTVLGYRVNGDSTAVAKIAISKNNVMECQTIIGYGLIMPPSSQSRASCIRTYAELTKNAAVCELLMPTRYGLDCVGEATNDRLCVIRPDHTVAGNGIYVAINDCIHGSQNIKSNPCCTIALVSSVRSVNDCSALKAQKSFYNECLNELAFKNHDPLICDPISDSNMKDGCVVSAKALQKDPSICVGCIPPVNSIEDLPHTILPPQHLL